jgi:hypothetical protein
MSSLARNGHGGKRIWVSLNPSQDMLSIRIIEMHPGADDILFISVVNTEGKIMYHQEVLLLDEYVHVPCKNWPSGIYLVSLEGDSFIYKEKVVIVK